MKILIFEGSLNPPTFIRNLIQGLLDAGNHVVLLGKQGGKGYNPGNKEDLFQVIVTNYLNANLLIHCFSFLYFSIRHPATFWSVKKVLAPAGSLKLYLKKWVLYCKIWLAQPDIIHFQWATHIEHYEDLICSGKFKVIVSLRGRQLNITPLANPKIANLYRRVFPIVHGFHAVSHAIATEAARYGAAKERVQVIYSIVPEGFYNAFEADKNPVRNPLSIISVGRFDWQKGYDYGIHALKILRSRGIDARYVIVAGDEWPENLNYIIQDCRMNNHVVLEKSVSHTEVVKLIKSHSVLLLPSLVEGIANVVLEAMAAGVPVVSTAAGGMNEVIKDNQTGWLVPIADANAMADALEKYAQVSVEELQVIRRNAFDQVWNSNRKESQVNKFIAFYTRVLKEEAA